MAAVAGSNFQRLAQWLVAAGIRAVLPVERWRLRRAEIELGALGWEQADFAAEIEVEILRVRDVEWQQARLINESAELAGRIAAATKRCDATDRAAVATGQRRAKQSERLTADCRRWRRRVAAVAAELAAVERQLKKWHDEQAALDREATAADRGPGQLPQRDFIERRRVAIRNFSRHERHRVQLAAELAEFRGRLAALRAALAAAVDEAAAADRQAAAERLACQREIGSLRRRKCAIAKELGRLDAAKENHFLVIGRCLADAGLAPMNQPRALDRVLAHRHRIAALAARLARRPSGVH